MHHPPTLIDTCNKAIELENALAAQSPHPNFIAKGCPIKAHGPTETLKFQKLSPIEMVEIRKHKLLHWQAYGLWSVLLP